MQHEFIFLFYESGEKRMPKATRKPNIVQCIVKWNLNISDYIFSRMSVLTEMQQSVTWPFCDIQCIEITREIGFWHAKLTKLEIWGLSSLLIVAGRGKSCLSFIF